MQRTANENIIGAPKMVIFQYCDSIIGLFSIAPNLVIDQPPLR